MEQWLRDLVASVASIEARAVASEEQRRDISDQVKRIAESTTRMEESLTYIKRDYQVLFDAHGVLAGRTTTVIGQLERETNIRLRSLEDESAERKRAESARRRRDGAAAGAIGAVFMKLVDMGVDWWRAKYGGP